MFSLFQFPNQNLLWFLNSTRWSNDCNVMWSALQTDCQWMTLPIARDSWATQSSDLPWGRSWGSCVWGRRSPSATLWGKCGVVPSLSPDWQAREKLLPVSHINKAIVVFYRLVSSKRVRWAQCWPRPPWGPICDSIYHLQRHVRKPFIDTLCRVAEI
jgi:hypothetical protein